MSSENLYERLLESEAVASLVAEMRIGERLRALDWSASQGSFFTDPVTAKMREMDIIARRYWQRGSEPERLRARLNLIVEAKTMRNYHLVFVPMLGAAREERVIVEREWIGYASERGVHQAQLRGVLDRVGLMQNEISSLFGELLKLAYPVELMVVSDLLPAPLPAPFLSSAFRETNIGGSKDLDTSVLRKATRALDNYMAYARADYLKDRHEDIELAADYAQNQSQNCADSVLSELSDSVRQVELFHSIVVVDAMLWAVTGDQMERLPWCRFCQLNRHGSTTHWYDIVQLEHVGEFFAQMTNHYDQHMDEAGAVPIDLLA